MARNACITRFQPKDSPGACAGSSQAGRTGSSLTPRSQAGRASCRRHRGRGGAPSLCCVSSANTVSSLCSAYTGPKCKVTGSLRLALRGCNSQFPPLLRRDGVLLPGSSAGGRCSQNNKDFRLSGEPYAPAWGQFKSSQSPEASHPSSCHHHVEE